MKVLFAVSNENISTQIVKRFQKEYKEIISYKNMYYFNAIVKELQRDNSYDRIVISEDLEPFANNNYDEIEKFLFEKLDNISDEATGSNGKDIPIILLASDKRVKSEQILVKLFGIGIYNVLLGQDRTAENVCNLLSKPRSKKEAKLYYKIEADEVRYKSESEENVSEAEIKNILNHYRKLGKDEDRYVESFNNIAAQYNDAQLRIITKFLPLNVKAVLEEQSPKYQSIMTFGDPASTLELMKKKKEEEGLKIGFLNYTNTNKPSEPVIVPTAIKKVATKRINKNNNLVEQPNIENESSQAETLLDFEAIEETKNDETLPGFEDVLEDLETIEVKEAVEPVKKGRGRPKKIVLEDEMPKVNTVKRGRGRPKKAVEEPVINEEKNVLSEVEDFREESVLPGFDDVNEDILPGFDDLENDTISNFNTVEENTLPGFEKLEEDDLPGFDTPDENVLPGFDDFEEDKTSTLPGFDDVEDDRVSHLPGFDDLEENNTLPGFDMDNNMQENLYQNQQASSLLSGDKKIVAFVGTTKNGTSFLVNNLAKCLSSMGIKTAILDLTLNRNSYYIYTKNEERLRNVAYESIRKLVNGIANGITVDKNLDVYTALPGDILPLEEASRILSTLSQNYSVVLMDCDFETPTGYFEISQEIYLVQSMDILTIQPLTGFLRELKAKNALKPEKLRIILNKEMKVKDLTSRAIIGGLSYYNDPAMSFMTELFNREIIKYCTIPFEQEVCSKYLSGIVNCEVTLNGYSKSFMTKLKELANMVYPLIENKKRTKNQFSDDMNNTLEQMKNRY